MKSSKYFLMALWAILMLPGSSVAQEDFSYLPAGYLTEGSGTGRVDDLVYVPGMRFPIEEAPAYANSQVWGNGGMYGPPNTNQCDAINFQYPWWDNYCEQRSWDMPLCPSGTGHQGQDLRPATCEDQKYWAVACESGKITDVGAYWVYLVSDAGTQHRYLHMNPGSVLVKVGNTVNRGDRMGLVSNAYDGSSTTIHLHYDINQFVENLGANVYVPPYMSLVRSYEELIGESAAPCQLIPAEGAIVDDSGPCFFSFGPPAYWHVETSGGENQNFHWTDTIARTTPSNWARWNLNFAKSGWYEVFVDVIPNYNVSKQVPYKIHHAGIVSDQVIDQSTVSDWVSLGEFEFKSGGGQSLEIFDNTGESATNTHFTADAVKLVLISLIPEEPNPADGGESEYSADGTEAITETSGDTENLLSDTPLNPSDEPSNNNSDLMQSDDANQFTDEIKEVDGGCGCQTHSDAFGWLLLGLVGFIVFSRRRVA